jgi:enamine deaminase RidA (YjgF/YER057c/UK114 family)
MRDIINPESMYSSIEFGFSHAALSTGGKLLHCAGQVAWDKNQNVVGPGDLALQMRQALKNLSTVLESVGAGPENLVRIRTYVVDYTPDKLAAIGPELAEFYGDLLPAPNTLLGVQALAMPDFLVEIEATAVVD